MSRLLTFLLTIALNQRKTMSALTDLQSAVAANTAAIGAATALIAQDKATIAAQAAQIVELQAQITDQAALAASFEGVAGVMTFGVAGITRMPPLCQSWMWLKPTMWVSARL